MGRPRIYTDEERAEHYKKYQREYYLKNKARRQEYKKKYYEEHKDEYLDRWHKWLSANRGKWNEYNRERNKKKKDGNTV